MKELKFESAWIFVCLVAGFMVVFSLRVCFAFILHCPFWWNVVAILGRAGGTIISFLCYSKNFWQGVSKHRDNNRMVILARKNL